MRVKTLVVNNRKLYKRMSIEQSYLETQAFLENESRSCLKGEMDMTKHHTPHELTRLFRVVNSRGLVLRFGLSWNYPAYWGMN